MAHYIDLDDLVYRLCPVISKSTMFKFILIEALQEHLYCSSTLTEKILTGSRLSTAGHHMPHILGAFHKPFRDKILLPSEVHFTGFSSIYISFSYPKIYIARHFYRLHPSSDTAFKFKFSLKRSMLS